MSGKDSRNVVFVNIQHADTNSISIMLSFTRINNKMDGFIIVFRF